MQPSIRRLCAVLLGVLLAAIVGTVATGRVGYVVTNGVSMNPIYHAGDLVVVARSGSYHSGQIVAYRTQAKDELVLHRIVGGDRAGFVIKGDNNQSTDLDHPSIGRVMGRAVLHIPKVGGIVESPITRGAVLLGVLALFAALNLGPKPSRASRSSTPARSRRDAWRALMALDVVLLAALGLTLTMGGHWATHANADGFAQTGELAYHADVPPSDTYPDGRLATGDPVYTRLLGTVDVSFHYATDAPPASVSGTARLDVAVSTADGWHSGFPLVAPTPLAAGGLALVGTLDLAKIRAIGDAVTKATGAGTSTLDVVVTASTDVTVDNARPVAYSSRLPFKLTPLALNLAGAKPTTSPQGPVVVSTTQLTPAANAPARSARGPSRQLRLGLLVAFLLSVGGTAMLWPSSKGPEDETGDPAVRRTRAVHVDLPPSTTSVELDDRSALEDLARTLGCPIVDREDGWEGVITGDAVYWVHTPRAATVTGPAQWLAPFDSSTVAAPSAAASACARTPTRRSDPGARPLSVGHRDAVEAPMIGK